MSPEGIVPARDEPASRGVPENIRGEPSRAQRGLVSPTFASWNQLGGWLRQVEALRDVA